MKRCIAFAFGALVAVGLTYMAGALEYEELSAQSAVLMDADTGQVLYNKNMNQKAYPASITKVMTGLLAAENCAMDDVVTVNASATELPYNTSHIALTEGEQITVGQAMYAMMLASANDASNALAEHMAGSQADFARMMTQKAKDLGAVNTNFTNAHGLHDNNHYTTAYDMALITREAADSEEFMEYFGTGRYTISPTNKQSEERPLTNMQYMLLEDMWVYSPEVQGGKVGYTDEARHTMTTVARKDGRTLIAVVMGCTKDEKFYDTQALFDLGFREFTEYTIPAGDIKDDVIPFLDASGNRIGSVRLYREEDIRVLVHQDMDVEQTELLYDYPTEYAESEELQATVSIRMPVTATGLEGNIQTIPVDAERVYYSEAAAVIEESGGIASPLSTVLITLSITASAVLFLLFALALVRRRCNAINRRRRVHRYLMQREIRNKSTE